MKCLKKAKLEPEAGTMLIKVFMTQDERWFSRFHEVKAFIETNHRNPSKYIPEEKLMTHFLKRGRKQLNAGENEHQEQPADTEEHREEPALN